MPGSTEQFLSVVARRRRSELVVTTMTAAKIWHRLADSPDDLNYLPSAMGHAGDLALGYALARPDRTVVCFNGDGSLLMNLGSLVTAVETGAANLVLLLLDNGAYRVVGGAPVPGAGRVRWDELARACGWPVVERCESPARLDEAWPRLVAGRGPAFAWLDVVDPLDAVERLPPRHPAESLRRLREDSLRRPSVEPGEFTGSESAEPPEN